MNKRAQLEAVNSELFDLAAEQRSQIVALLEAVATWRKLYENAVAIREAECDRFYWAMMSRSVS